jgi:pyruvate ferredoxin oxidoreductase beta subunit
VVAGLGGRAITRSSLQRVFRQAVAQPKSVPKIAVAHGIPYVATASVADLHDLECKVIKAMGVHGARYIHIHVPCPLGWGTASHDTIRLARLAIECGLFPLFEAEHGVITGRRKIRQRVPVDEYLRPQKRFAHLFKDAASEQRVASLQALADRNIAELGLLDGEGGS